MVQVLQLIDLQKGMYRVGQRGAGNRLQGDETNGTPQPIVRLITLL